jgi:hypothetical protein
MLFVTYNPETGALIGVTAEPPPADPAVATRAISATSVELQTWDPAQRAFREELSGVETWKITRLAFRNRFTMAEKAAMEIAGLDNPLAGMPDRQKSAVLRAYMADVASSTFVDLQRPDTRAGVLQLEALGLLAAGRAAQILDTAPAPQEVFLGN